ncbi:hypothetical protein Pelo_11760 [Pelomyxa schiedti]|nr:hypothetical protein Pelo_11760 [Pelomyxa schiedti]
MLSVVKFIDAGHQFVALGCGVLPRCGTSSAANALSATLLRHIGSLWVVSESRIVTFCAHRGPCDPVDRALHTFVFSTSPTLGLVRGLLDVHSSPEHFGCAWLPSHGPHSDRLHSLILKSVNPEGGVRGPLAGTVVDYYNYAGGSTVLHARLNDKWAVVIGATGNSRDGYRDLALCIHIWPAPDFLQGHAVEVPLVGDGADDCPVAADFTCSLSSECGTAATDEFTVVFSFWLIVTIDLAASYSTGALVTTRSKEGHYGTPARCHLIDGRFLHTPRGPAVVLCSKFASPDARCYIMYLATGRLDRAAAFPFGQVEGCTVAAFRDDTGVCVVYDARRTLPGPVCVHKRGEAGSSVKVVRPGMVVHVHNHIELCKYPFMPLTVTTLEFVEATSGMHVLTLSSDEGKTPLEVTSYCLF